MNRKFKKIIFFLFVLLLIALIYNLYMQNYYLTQKLPTALIIGAAKCGTSALAEFLAVHPNVAIPKIDYEISYFNFKYTLNDEWYLRQMPFSNQHQITIESTALYMANKDVPKRVFSLNQKMKLIIILRDPVIRAISHHVELRETMENYRKSMLFLNLTDAQQFENKIIDSYDNSIYNTNKSSTRGVRKISDRWDPIKQGHYYQYIQKCLEYFPKEQFIFLNGKKF